MYAEEFIKGGALSVDKLIMEKATPILTPDEIQTFESHYAEC